MSISLRSDPTRSALIVNGVDVLYINGDGSVEIAAPVAAPAGGQVPTAGQLGFGKMYESPQQTMAAAGTVVLPHGLGSRPKLISCQLVCLTADAGYSTGDVVQVLNQAYDGAGLVSSGMTPLLDATNITLRFGSTSPCFVNHKTTGAVSQVVVANWRLVVRAWA